MSGEEKVESLIIQRMIERSNTLRIGTATNTDRQEERAVILSAIGDDGFFSENSHSQNTKCAQRFNYEDKNFHRVFPWNKLSFFMTDFVSPVNKVEKEQSAITCLPVTHSTQMTEKFKEPFSDDSPKGSENSFEDFISPHKCSRTFSFIASSPNGSTSVNKTGNTEFSDCFHCNAMLVHRDLCKWKKDIATQSESLEKVPVSVHNDKFTNNYTSGQEHPTSFVLSRRNLAMKDFRRSKLRQSKIFKSPLRSSSPELETSMLTEFLVSQQQGNEQEGSGTSMESISTIPEKQSDSNSLSATQELKDLEAMMLYAAEVNSMDTMEDNVSQLAEATTYNVEWFLRDALGDELDISICTESHDNQGTNLETSEDGCVSNNGESLFHTISSYRMLTNLKRQKVRPHLTSLKMCVPDASTSASENHLQSAVQSLLLKAETHMSIIIQARKARDLCDQSKEFITSRERVECERILLIATHIRNAAYNEIHRLKFEDCLDTSFCFEIGTVSISEMSLKLKEDFQKSALLDVEMKTWFLCVMSHNGRVLATEAESEIQEGNIKFSGCYTFTELRKDFTIKVQVYCLKLRKQIPGCQSKPLSLIPMTVFGCPGSCKKVKNSFKKNNPEFHERIQTSSFNPAGELHLHLHDVHCSKPWPLCKVPLSSPLVGIIDFELKTSLKLTAEYSGFLNLSEESSLPGSWQKYWFYLKEHMLYYWNYPSDIDVKEPVGKIDLSKCLTKTIGSVSRSQCARPRTFVIETNTQYTSSNVMRHFLSADTALEMNQWCCVLNKVIRSLREWNIIKFNF